MYPLESPLIVPLAARLVRHETWGAFEPDPRVAPPVPRLPRLRRLIGAILFAQETQSPVPTGPDALASASRTSRPGMP
jgi:hypothetical protein